MELDRDNDKLWDIHEAAGFSSYVYLGIDAKDISREVRFES
jgi:hypothetical protein